MCNRVMLTEVTIEMFQSEAHLEMFHKGNISVSALLPFPFGTAQNIAVSFSTNQEVLKQASVTCGASLPSPLLHPSQG